jgi:aerobic carbon-monoxide dehydrogenase medium subunit
MPFVQPGCRWLRRPLTSRVIPYSPAPGPVWPLLQETSVIPSAFDYHAPTNLSDAIALLGRYGDEAKLLAGGHSLLPMMKLRFAAPGHLIDLGRIPDLRGITQAGAEIHIGAMTTENELIWSPLLADKVPLLVEGARWIADPQVRYCGTVGGDISHGDPANDHPALMLALGASFVLRGPQGERVVKAADFFLGLYATELQPGEVLTRIQVPIPAPGTGWAYEKLKRKIGDFATAAAAVLLAMDRGRVASVSIALTNAGATPLKATEAEAALLWRPLDDAALADAARLAMDICDPVADQRGDADYKRAMAGEMTRRALLKAQQRAA